MFTTRSQMIRSRQLLVLVLLLTSRVAIAESLNVLVSITPFHGIVSELMAGVETPDLLLPASASPHSYQLKPSNMTSLQDARLIFWGGDFVEPFLTKPLKHCHPKQTCINLSHTPGLKLLSYRNAELEATHTHHHEEHTHHHEEHSHHHHNGTDPHYWLSPNNALVLATHITDELIKADPNHQAIYLNNLKQFKHRVTRLDEQLTHQLSSIKDKPFVVFHDAYQYFETHYGLSAVGAITLDPDIPPSAKHLKHLATTIKEQRALCLFAEPQFQPKIINTLQQATQIKVSTLDPLGKEGQSYTELLDSISSALNDCMKKIE